MIIVDIEASGLHQESYPIEIAWQDSDNPDNFDSFLIIPLESWTYWDDYAEQEIHRISRNELSNSGITAQAACERLNTALMNEMIYSDAVQYDQRWIMTLFNAVGISAKFKLGSILDLLPLDELSNYEQLLGSKAVKHRALDDVRQIIKWVNCNI